MLAVNPRAVQRPSRKEAKMEKMSPIKALRTFFEANGGRKVTLQEFQALTTEERLALGRLAAVALGVELEVK